MQARTHGLAVTLRPGNLARHVHGRGKRGGLGRVQAQMHVQQTRSIQEGVAVHDAVARELRLLQAGNHAKYAPLFGEGEVGLEAH